jgi:hypothetical protein
MNSTDHTLKLNQTNTDFTSTWEEHTDASSSTVLGLLFLARPLQRRKMIATTTSWVLIFLIKRRSLWMLLVDKLCVPGSGYMPPAVLLRDVITGNAMRRTTFPPPWGGKRRSHQIYSKIMKTPTTPSKFELQGWLVASFWNYGGRKAFFLWIMHQHVSSTITMLAATTTDLHWHHRTTSLWTYIIGGHSSRLHHKQLPLHSVCFRDEPSGLGGGVLLHKTRRTP